VEDELVDSFAARRVANRERQRALYGAPLGDRVRRLTSTLGVSQARLARALGMSTAMLSQLVSARRVKIGDPAVLARLLILDQRCQSLTERPERPAVDEILADSARTRWQWNESPAGPEQGVTVNGHGERRRPVDRRVPVEGAAVAALRSIADPAKLAAAAAALGPGFPELAEVLRQAASRPRT
jgi:transcriptional regulator with XRE-family HTH domain